MLFLPQNPCCTTAPLVTPVACGCDPCSAAPVPTNNVSYSGPNLACTLIRTCDSATVAFQKIETQICTLKQQIAALQATVADCCPTTTTTSTSTSSTTTTTTTVLCPSCSFYSITNSTVSPITITYYECGGILVNTSVAGPSTVYVCACTGTLVVPPVPGVTSANLGACPV